MKLSPMTTTLGVGAFFSVWHALWSLLVALGLAQPFLNFIFDLHMITPAYHVEAFSFGRAIALILVTAIVGGIVGFIFASVWNMVEKK